jgi:hypothetical protein
VGCISRRRQFIKQYPSGCLNRGDFFLHYGSSYTQEASDRLFDLIDQNKDGTIDTNEWVIAKNLIQAGGLGKKLKCGYHLSRSEIVD